MRRTLSLILVVGAACASGEWSPAAAQISGYGPGVSPAVTRPRVSPYLNLLRGGGTPAGNYLTLVRPELDAQRSINQLRFSTATNQQAIQGLQQGPAGAVATGHPVGFQTQGSYFQSFGGGGGPGFSVGGRAGGGQGFQGNTNNRGSGGPGSGVPRGRTGR